MKVARALLAAVVLGAAPLAPLELEPVPAPSLDRMEPLVREQLRAALEEAESASGSASAEVQGRLGQLLILYGYSEAASAAFRNANALAPDTFDWVYYLGSIAHQERDLEVAEATLERALELRPGDPATLVRLGQIELERGDLASAGQRFAAARDAAPAAVEAGLGRIAVLENRGADAADHYRRALEIQPGATALHYQLAIVLRELGDTQAASRHLALRGSTEVTFPDPLRDELSDLVTGAGIHVSRAARARQRGDNAAAIAAFRSALEIDPDHIGAREGLAATLAIMGQTGAAREELEEVIRLHPDSISALYNLANLEAAAGRSQRAEDLYSQALALAPDYARARRNLAGLLASQGRYTEALRHYDVAIEANPTDIDSRRQRAAIWAETGHLQEAVEELGRVIALDARPADHRLRARLLGRLGEYLAAGREFEQLLALEPANIEAAFGRALSYLLGGAYEAARGALEEGLTASPGDVGLEHLLARLLATCPQADMRDGERALALALRVFEADPTPEHAETVAMAYAEAGRFEQAIALQEQVLEVVSGSGDQAAVRAAGRYLEAYRDHRAVRAPWEDPED